MSTVNSETKSKHPESYLDGPEDISNGVVSSPHHLDRALEVLQANRGTSHDPEVAKRVLRKIDCIVMPMMCAIYTMMLMDKSSLSFAAIMGIKNDCNLTGSEYSWLGSLIYFGYLAGDIPSVYILQRWTIDKAFAAVVIIWGLVVALHAACSGFVSLAVLRFVLGFGEVFTTPVVLQIFSSWYTKEEQLVRMPIWYTCYGLANIFGGLLAWALYQAGSFRWQGLFVLYGSMTMVLGILLYLFVPASPTRASWLTEEEKAIVLERVRPNKTGTEVWRFNADQLKEAFQDPRLYVVFLILVSLGLPTGGITVFGPSIISGLGFGDEKSTLLSMAPGGVAIIGVLVCTVIGRKTNRTIAGLFSFALSIIGTIMLFAIPESQNAPRYGGYVLALLFPLSNPFLMAMITGGVSGSTKKFAFAASYQLGYAVGNIIGPQTYREQDAPNYYPAKYTMLAFLIFGAIMLSTIGLIHRFWNIRKGKQDVYDAENVTVADQSENEEFLDRTDFQIRSFVYPL